jgi:hypothetical protein
VPRWNLVSTASLREARLESKLAPPSHDRAYLPARKEAVHWRWYVGARKDQFKCRRDR